MALSGIQIFKLLPKTNCKECGVPTCLAFAMNLASGKAELESCPYASDEAKEILAEASAPPIRQFEIGYGENKVKVGGELVMFRHEKTFYNPTALAALITTDMDRDVVDAKLRKWNTFQYERVGLNLRPEIVAIKDTKGEAGTFSSLVKQVFDTSNFSYILMSESPGVIEAGLKAQEGTKPLIYAATKDNIDKMTVLAKEYNCPLAIKAVDIEELIELSNKAQEAGVKDLVLDSGARSLKKAHEEQVAIRRAALFDKNKALGFPTICLPFEMAETLEEETIFAALFIAKYGAIVVMSDFEGSYVFPLLLERLNIFTDPQRPMVVTPGIYEINNPDENSPICITSNFALTYFIVSGEIESSRVPTWLLIMDTEGLSVMTAWAAGKFVGDAVGIFIKKCGIQDKVSKRRVVIPGYAAAISGDLEEELGSEWEVNIGPRDGSLIPKYLRDFN
ncbi:MAG: acetyl-CoA decarbonylase/synthase complex subunit gamma [Thermodesulfobacteriota bacterium]|nr:acetyl-CoA decarbonylase/synthase complex subunit gamma [Thermodesulfobacteriota bacterium]